MRILFITILIFSSSYLNATFAQSAYLNLIHILNNKNESQLRFFPSEQKSNFTNKIYPILSRAKQYIWDQPDLANYWVDSAFNLSKSLHNFQGLTETEVVKAMIEIGKGKLDNSFIHFRYAFGYLPYAEKKEQLLTGLLINLGASSLYQADYESAVKYYYLALQYMINYRQNDLNLLMAYNNIADVFIRMKQFDKANDYLGKGEFLALKKNDYSVLSYIYVNKADIEIVKQNYNQANIFLKKSTYYNQMVPDKDVAQAVMICKGRIMLQLNQPQEAVSLLTTALEYNTESTPYYAYVAPQYLLGAALYKTGRYTKAEAILTSALKKASGIGIREEQLDALLVLADVYKVLKKSNKELEIRRSIIKLQDELLNKEKIEAINQLEVKYRTAQKDKELAEKKLLITEQKRKIEENKVLFSLILMGLLSVIGIVFFKNKSNKQKEKITLLKAMIEGEEKERTRIAQELHDGIGGQLAAIQMHCSAQENRSDNNLSRILQMLQQTSKEVRETSHNLMPQAIKQFSLQEALFQFCQNINKSNDINLQLQILSPLPEISEQKRLNIYRIIQEVIQNIIKHASAQNAIIQIAFHNKKLNLVLEDDGIGFDIKEIKKGLGLNNIEVRVHTLNGHLSIDTQENKGTTINIEIPI